MTEDRRQRTEDRGRSSEVGMRKAEKEVGMRNSEKKNSEEEV